MISIQSKKSLESVMDFMYAYLSLKAYFFTGRTKVMDTEYPNSEYVKIWRENFSISKPEKIVETIFAEPEFSCIDFCDTLDRASYFALIHPNHPNITLGFIKDADLWNIWLCEAPFSVARDVISEILNLGEDSTKIVDFGCGSVSPHYYGNIVGSKGIYTGIDHSHSILKIAENRIKSENLDWVNLKKFNIESKLIAKRKYDVVICSSILQYVNLKPVLKNAGEMVGYDGRIIIFSEVFSDLEPEKEKILKLYYSLIPNFKKFPSVSEILEILDLMGVCYKYKIVCKNILLLELVGR